MCGEKQSIKRFYGIGTGKECRLHVQKLNEIQGDIHNLKLKKEDSDESGTSQDEETGSDSNNQCKTVLNEVNKKSKWTHYVDVVQETNCQILDKNTYLNETEVELELPKKKPRISEHFFNTSNSISSENRYVPVTRVNNNGTKDKNVETKKLNTFIRNLDHSDLISPAKTESLEKNHLSTPNNSKWAQYVEEEKILDTVNPTINDQTDLNDAHNIFSLNDDDDNLDAILDF